MSSLFVLLPAEPATSGTEFAYLVSQDGRSVGAHASAPAALLPEARGAGAQTVAVVPAAALSWHRVELPKGVGAGSTRLRAVLEGQLEEQLLDEPEALHFALDPQPRPGAPVWVAVCQRAWLRNALQTLASAGHPVSRIVPEVAPEAPGALHVVGDADDALVIASSAEGVLAMPLSAGALSLLPPLDADLPCFAEPAVAAQAEQLLQRPVVLQTAGQRWLQAAQSGWDLAQFEFASSGRARAFKQWTGLWGELLRAPRWRAARWGAALLVAANLVGLNAWAWRERAALQAKQQAVRSTLTSTFPQVRLVVDAPLQMAREVAALRQATGAASGGDFESLLGVLATAAQGRRPEGLEFTGAELRVRGLGWTADDLSRAQPALRSQGVSARLQGDLLVLAPEGVQ